MSEPPRPAPPRQGLSIRRKLLRGLAVRLYRHPTLSLLLLVVLSIASLRQIERIEVSADLSAYAPRHSDEARAWEAIEAVAPTRDPLLLGLRFHPGTDPTARQRAARALERALDALPEIARYEALRPDPVPNEWHYESILQGLRPRDLEQLEMRLREGAPPSGPEADPYRFFETVRARSLHPARAPTPARLPAPDSWRLYPRDSAYDLFFCLGLAERLEVLTRQLQAEQGALKAVTIEGRHLRTAQRTRALLSAALRSAVVLGLCLLALALLAFRKLEALLFVGLPPLLGLIWTFGLLAWVSPRLSLPTAFFPFLFMAFGVEYALQIYHRFIEELYREQRYYPALGRAYTESGRGLVVAGICSALVFGSLGVVGGGPKLGELALAGALASLAMGLAPLLALPPMAAVKSSLARGRVHPLEHRYGFGMHRLSAAVLASPQATLTLALLLSCYLGYHARFLEIDHEVGLSLSASAERRPAAGMQMVRGAGDERPLRILADAPDATRLWEAMERLQTTLEAAARDPRQGIAALRTPAGLLPPARLSRQARERLLALDLGQVGRQLRQLCQRRGAPPGCHDAFLAALTGLVRQARLWAPPRPDTLPPDQQVQRQALTAQANGRHLGLTRVYGHPGGAPGFLDDFDKLRARLVERMPEGVRLHFEHELLRNRQVSREVLQALARQAFAAAAIVFLCLWLHFRRRLRETLLAMLPLVCAAVWCFGLLSLLRFEVGLFGLLIYPLVLGIQVSQATLLTQRIEHRRFASPRQILRAGGRPGMVSVWTLALGFGCLAQTGFPALTEMAAVALSASIVAGFATLTLVPTLVLLKPGQGWRGLLLLRFEQGPREKR